MVTSSTFFDQRKSNHKFHEEQITVHALSSITRNIAHGKLRQEIISDNDYP